MVKRSKYIPGSILHVNDLLPWFLEDQSKLPAAYVASCRKFFNELKVKNDKLQASSYKLDKSTGKL